MKVVGLTGGIGTGKSTVSAYLIQKNIPIVDADRISRMLTADGSPLLEDVRHLLGDEAFHPDGSLNRQKVADMIFSDSQLLKAYEALITAEAARQCLIQLDLLRVSGKYSLAVLDAPLLFECGLQDKTDEVWVVDADINVRIARVMARDGLSEDAIRDRINRQMPSSEKAALADYVIDNSGTLEQLYVQIDRLLERTGYEG